MMYGLMQNLRSWVFPFMAGFHRTITAVWGQL